MEPFSRDTHSVSPSSPLVFPSRPRHQSVSPVRINTHPEDEIPSGQEQGAVAKESKSPYNQARMYIESFTHRNELTSNSRESYEEPFAIKMPVKEWFKLIEDLDIFETDQKYDKFLEWSLRGGNHGVPE